MTRKPETYNPKFAKKTLKIFVFLAALSLVSPNIIPASAETTVFSTNDLAALPSTILSGGEMLLGLVREASSQNENVVSVPQETDEAALLLYTLKSHFDSGARFASIADVKDMDQLKAEYLLLAERLREEKARTQNLATKVIYDEILELIQVHLGLIDTLKKKILSSDSPQSGMTNPRVSLENFSKVVGFIQQIRNPKSEIRNVFRGARVLLFPDTSPGKLLTWCVEVAASDLWGGLSS